MEVAGKTVIITGGGSGLGAATASYLSSKGAKIAILDLSDVAATQVARQHGALAIHCDVTDEGHVAQALEKIGEQLGAIHVCINCAGIAPGKRIVGMDGPMPLIDFQRVISVNLIGTFNVMRLVAASMMKNQPTGDNQERGVIINTASIAAYEGQIGQAAYSASKGAIVALTLPAARELAQFGIRVMTIAPGLMKTPLVDGLSPETQAGLTVNIPFPKRLGTGQEFAMLVEHIIENCYLNGAVIRLDAGLRMQAK